MRVHPGLFPALRHARGRRRPRRARDRPPALPGGLRAECLAGQDGRERCRRCRSTRSSGSTTGSPRYIEDRRREPRHDVLTDLALATYQDGSTPDVVSVVRTASFLFAAGQETTARLLAVALKYLAEYPELQDELRAHRERIPDFIEEALRIESPVKADFRLARAPDLGRRRRHRCGHTGDAPQRRRQPRPSPVRVPGRVPARPPECQGSHCVRSRRPLVSWRSIGEGGGSGQPRAHPRPPARHPALRRAPRSAG